jgi:hypothetical protein
MTDKKEVFCAWLSKAEDDDDDDHNINYEKKLALKYQNINGDIYSRISLITDYTAQVDHTQYTYLGDVIKI